MHELPTGTVTLLFSDIEGSAHLLQQLGDRYALVLSECRRLLHEAFRHWNGYEVDTQGDAFFVAFARATDAASAAVAAHLARPPYRGTGDDRARCIHPEARCCTAPSPVCGRAYSATGPGRTR